MGAKSHARKSCKLVLRFIYYKSLSCILFFLFVPGMLISYHGNDAAVDVLLRHKDIDVHVKNHNGLTALHIAVDRQKRRVAERIHSYLFERRLQEGNLKT